METTTQLLEEERIAATPGSSAKLIKEIRYKTRKKISAEDKIRIVLEGFRKEIPISDLCRRENISTTIYYSWLKDFMEAGKARLKGDTLRDATKGEVRRLSEENTRLKELVGEQSLQIQLLKKSLNL
jgi:transposase